MFAHPIRPWAPFSDYTLLATGKAYFLCWRKIECIERLIHFARFLVPDTFYVRREYLSSLIWPHVFLIMINPFSNNPGYWKNVLSTFGKKFLVARSRWVRNGFDLRQHEEWFISPVCNTYSSKSVNHVSPGTPWNVGSDLQWNLSVTTTSIIRFITCNLFSNVF